MLMAFRDLRIGAGFGVVDAYGRPKAPWFVLRRLFDPVSVLLTDEGLNGLSIHVVNETGEPLHASVHIELFADGHMPVDRGETQLVVSPRSMEQVWSDCLFDSFRDITYSYRFAPPSHDVVKVSLRAETPQGQVVERDACFLPLGPGRDWEHDVGIAATAVPLDDGRWALEVRTERFAQYVAIDAPGYLPSDSWFHLAPKASKTVVLEPYDGRSAPSGEVRALNSRVAARIAR